MLVRIYISPVHDQKKDQINLTVESEEQCKLLEKIAADCQFETETNKKDNAYHLRMRPSSSEPEEDSAKKGIPLHKRETFGRWLDRMKEEFAYEFAEVLNESIRARNNYLREMLRIASVAIALSAKPTAEELKRIVRSTHNTL